MSALGRIDTIAVSELLTSFVRSTTGKPRVSDAISRVAAEAAEAAAAEAAAAGTALASAATTQLCKPTQVPDDVAVCAVGGGVGGACTDASWDPGEIRHPTDIRWADESSEDDAATLDVEAPASRR